MFDALVMKGWKEGADRGEATPEHWTVSNRRRALRRQGQEPLERRELRRLRDDLRLALDEGAPGRMQRPVIGCRRQRDVKNADGSDKTVEVEERDSGIYLRGSSKSQVNIWSWPCGSGEVYGYRTDASTIAGGARGRDAQEALPMRPIGQWNRFRIRMVGETFATSGTTAST
jgi:hypothetical protein